LGSHHHLVIEALITIAKNRGVKFATAVPTVSCDSHLLLETSSDEGPSPQIMPMFCNIIRDATISDSSLFWSAQYASTFALV
jgi:hypothetical protein